MSDIVLTSNIATVNAKNLLSRIEQGKKVTAEERLEVIQNIFAFSPRDWSTDKELLLLYRVATLDPSENQEESR